MTRRAFAEQLEATANHIADASRADLQVMLRRAALVLRNVNGNTIVGDWTAGSV